MYLTTTQNYFCSLVSLQVGLPSLTRVKSGAAFLLTTFAFVDADVMASAQLTLWNTRQNIATRRSFVDVLSVVGYYTAYVHHLPVDDVKRLTDACSLNPVL